MKKTLLLLAILNSHNCFAEVVEKLTYHYYNVTSKNGEGLKDAAFKATPIKQNGKKFLGNTDWRTQWTYSYKTSKNQCVITRLTILTKITITLPKLTNASPKQQQIFNDYLAKLKTHELNHARLALQYNKRLEQKLIQIKPQPNCNQLIKLIDDTANQSVKDSQKANDAYDNKTNHGATEGVILKNTKNTN